VVSLDNQPLAVSGKILIQVGTQYLPAGWNEEPAEFVYSLDKNTYKGYRVLNTGTMPWKASNTRVRIEMASSMVNKATLLDVAGYPMQSVALKRSGKKISLTLPANAMYLILEK
jgi:hypothetical protein